MAHHDACHVATLENRNGFDAETITEQDTSRPGVQVVTGCRHGSRTSEGIEYRFSAETFDATEAREWLTSKGVTFRSFAAATDDAVTLEADGTYTLRGIECAKEGTWYADVGGRVEMTAAMLDTAVKETNEAIDLLKPALTLGHLSGGKQWVGVPDGGQPRLGFASQFYRKGKSVMCDLRRVPATIVKAIRLGMWGRISPDLMAGWPDPTTKERRPVVFTALALLGATPPAISTLQDLSDWIEGQDVKKASGVEMALSLALSDVVSFVECGAAPAVSAAVSHDEGKQTNQEPTNQGGSEMTPEMETAITALVEKLIAKALGSASGGDAEMKQRAEMSAMRAELYTDRLTRAAAEGKIKAGEIAPMANGLIEMSHATATATLAAIEARDGKVQPTNPLGNVTPPADPLAGLEGEQRLIALAQGLCKDEKISFRDAWIRIGNENREEYDAYRQKAFPVVGSKKEN